MYTVCTLTMICIYNVCTLYIHDMYYMVRTVYIQISFELKNEFVHTSFIFFGSVWKQSVLSTYFVHQYTRLKASQQHIPDQSKHSFQSSRFRFGTTSHCTGRRDLWLRPAHRQAAHPRQPRLPRWPPPQRGRAGCAGLRCSARPFCRTVGRTSALDGHLHQRSWRFQHGPLAPTVLTIHRAAMDHVVKDVMWWCWRCKLQRR